MTKPYVHKKMGMDQNCHYGNRADFFQTTQRFLVYNKSLSLISVQALELHKYTVSMYFIYTFEMWYLQCHHFRD